MVTITQVGAINQDKTVEDIITEIDAWSDTLKVNKDDITLGYVMYVDEVYHDIKKDIKDKGITSKIYPKLYSKLATFKSLLNFKMDIKTPYEEDIVYFRRSQEWGRLAKKLRAESNHQCEMCESLRKYADYNCIDYEDIPITSDVTLHDMVSRPLSERMKKGEMEVHHIIPLRGYNRKGEIYDFDSYNTAWDLRLNPNNLIVLCKAHHRQEHNEIDKKIAEIAKKHKKGASCPQSNQPKDKFL